MDVRIRKESACKVEVFAQPSYFDRHPNHFLHLWLEIPSLVGRNRVFLHRNNPCTTLCCRDHAGFRCKIHTEDIRKRRLNVISIYRMWYYAFSFLYTCLHDKCGTCNFQKIYSLCCDCAVNFPFALFYSQMTSFCFAFSLSLCTENWVVQ